MDICAQNPRHQLLEHLDRSFSNPFAERSLVSISFPSFFLFPYRTRAYSSFLIFAFHGVHSASILSLSLSFSVRSAVRIDAGNYVRREFRRIGAGIGENCAERGCHLSLLVYASLLILSETKRNETRRVETKNPCVCRAQTVRPCSRQFPAPLGGLHERAASQRHSVER